MPTDDASIPNDAFMVTISTSQSLTVGISVGTGDALICTSSCSLTMPSLALGVDNAGTFINSGTVTISSAGSAAGGFFNCGTVINRGTITVSMGSGSSGGFFSYGTFTNFGIVTVTVGDGTSSGGFFNYGPFTNFGTVTITGPQFRFFNDAIFINECHGTVNKAPDFGNPVTIVECVVGGEVLSLDYGSLAFSAVPWILILATLAAGAAIILRRKFKLLL